MKLFLLALFLIAVEGEKLHKKRSTILVRHNQNIKLRSDFEGSVEDSEASRIKLERELKRRAAEELLEMFKLQVWSVR